MRQNLSVFFQRAHRQIKRKKLTKAVKKQAILCFKKINILFPEEIHSAITYSKKDKNSSDSEVALAIALAYVQSSK